MPTTVTNFGKVTASTGYDASATSVVLSSGHGSRLPSVFPYPLVWWNATDYPDPADDPNKEIVTVTARTSDTLTITRGSESTSASTKNTGGKTYKLILGMTAAMWQEISAVNNTPGTPIINGNMIIWQRGTTFTSPVFNSFTADRWAWNFVGAMAVTITQSSSVPTVAQAGMLFNYSLQVDVTTADNSLAAGDYAFLYQAIEGLNWRHFAQRDLVLSFWVKATKTGLHAAVVWNRGIDRGYVGTYTVNAADTWELKSITISASPSTGTWDYDTDVGLAVAFPLGTGSNGQIAAGSWQTLTLGPGLGTATTVNDVDSTSNFFSITGVKLELGSVATPIQFRSFSDELTACERYYEKSFPYATTPAQNTGSIAGAFVLGSPVGASTAFTAGWVSFKTRKRGGGVVLYNPSAANAHMRNVTDSTDCTGTTVAGAGETGFAITATTPAGTVAGEQLAIHWAISGEL